MVKPEQLTKEMVREVWARRWSGSWDMTRTAQLFLNGNPTQRHDAAVELCAALNKDV